MEKIQVEEPIYPLLGIVVSIVIFCMGLIFSKTTGIFWLLIGLSFLYIAFGYAKPMIFGLIIFSVLGCLTGLGAWLTSGSYLVGVQTYGRVILLAYASVLMVAMPPIHLTRNLVQLKFPRVLTLGMLITVRFIPLLLEEIIQIRMAMKTRGVMGMTGSYKTLYRAFFLPLMMRLISISDIMAISLETRGFSMIEHPSTLYKKIYFKRRDHVFIMGLLLVLIGAWYGR